MKLICSFMTTLFLIACSLSPTKSLGEAKGLISELENGEYVTLIFAPDGFVLPPLTISKSSIMANGESRVLSLGLFNRIAELSDDIATREFSEFCTLKGQVIFSHYNKTGNLIQKFKGPYDQCNQIDLEVYHEIGLTIDWVKDHPYPYADK